MTPWKLESLVQECGTWMFSADQNHSQTHPPNERLWFAPPVLTHTNQDPTSPNLDIEDARKVFDSLEKRRLITQTLITLTEQNGTQRQHLVFIVNRDLEKEWGKLISKNGFFNMKASPIVYYFFGSENPWFWLLLAFISAAFFGEMFKQFGGDVYSVIKEWILGHS